MENNEQIFRLQTAKDRDKKLFIRTASIQLCSMVATDRINNSYIDNAQEAILMAEALYNELKKEGYFDN